MIGVPKVVDLPELNVRWAGRVQVTLLATLENIWFTDSILIQVIVRILEYCMWALYFIVMLSQILNDVLLRNDPCLNDVMVR